jgi:hypothetical protein
MIISIMKMIYKPSKSRQALSLTKSKIQKLRKR